MNLVPFSLEPMCPAYLTLDSGPVDIKVQMRDQFGTQITGKFLDDNLVYVSLKLSNESDCTITYDDANSTQLLNSETGYAVFENLSFRGFQNSTCSLSFTTNITIQTEVNCSLILYGCEAGEGVRNSGSYDTCTPSKINSVFLNYINYVYFNILFLLKMLLVYLKY